MNSNDEKFAIRLESDDGLEKLIIFLKKRKYPEVLELEGMNKELRLLKRRFGFRNYDEMLTELENNPNFLQEVVKSLKDQDRSSQTSTSHISMLRIRKKRTLKDYISIPEKESKKRYHNNIFFCITLIIVKN